MLPMALQRQVILVIKVDVRGSPKKVAVADIQLICPSVLCRYERHENL